MAKLHFESNWCAKEADFARTQRIGPNFDESATAPSTAWCTPPAND
jgi:hypothetical protein